MTAGTATAGGMVASGLAEPTERRGVPPGLGREVAAEPEGVDPPPPPSSVLTTSDGARIRDGNRLYRGHPR